MEGEGELSEQNKLKDANWHVFECMCTVYISCTPIEELLVYSHHYMYISRCDVLICRGLPVYMFEYLCLVAIIIIRAPTFVYL